MGEICKIDNTEHGNLNELHAHLRKLKITQQYYYEVHYPRMDLLTGEKIPYKTYSDYFQSDFLNKNNLKKYCTNNPKLGLEWGINFLKRRAAEKKSLRAFHHVELRSLFCPSVRFFEEYGDYAQICKGIGLKVPFDYKKELTFTPLSSRATIIQDSREQTPLELKKSKVKKLDYGDYAIGGKFDKGINVERKSLQDFCSTLSKGYDRFCREIDRAKADNAYLVVLVEDDINKALSFDHDFRLRYAQTTPSHVFNKLRRILAKYDNIQFVFAKGRDEAARVLVKLFELGEQVRNCDLEYFYELKKI
jgi:hypothetical protein